jgi:hypothetical protein
MRNRMLAMVVLLIPALTWAGWFGGDKTESKPATTAQARRYVLKVPNKASERDLVQLIGFKQNLIEEMIVMARLTEEKQTQLQEFQKALLGAFEMNPVTNYQYDPKTKTIYELSPSASGAATSPPPRGATTLPPAGFTRRLHLQLTTDQQIQQFLRMTAGKKLVQDEMKVFASVIREKQVQLESVGNLLSQKFAISKDRNYEYDPTTMRLYDLGAPATHAKAPASGSSAIQLRATLPQQMGPAAADDLQQPVPLR